MCVCVHAFIVDYGNSYVLQLFITIYHFCVYLYTIMCIYIYIYIYVFVFNLLIAAL